MDLPWSLGRLAGEVTAALHAAADAVLPARCAGCEAAGVRLLCPDCASALTGPATVRWPRPVPSGLPPPWAVADYAGAVRASLISYKEDGRVALGAPLGAALARAVRAGAGSGPADPRCLALVPVPSRPAAVRGRGHDHVRTLARHAAAALRRAGTGAVVVAALRQVRATADQSGLDAGARAENLRGALATRPDARLALAGRVVVVVDDLVTTGATLAEATRALRAAGARPAAVAAVAATRRTGLRERRTGMRDRTGED